ncbi:MAG: PDZ domain-containing protein [bacterium]
MIGRIRSLKLGPYAFENLVSSFTHSESDAACASHGMDADGNLGVVIISRFHVVIDYPHQRLLLTPNNQFGKPFEYNMAGLSMEQVNDGSLYVRDVIAGSPADEAGITKGDRIVAVDDRPIGAYDYFEMYQMFRQHGRTLRVLISRATDHVEKILKLKRLI